MATAGQLTWARLVAIARRVGVKVVEAPSTHRGKLGSMGSVVGITEHTTGTPNTFKPTVDYPDFNVVKEGRVGLENSLSAYGIGRFEAIYVFSEYLSWHAGAWSWLGVTDGNGHFLGIECAGVGDYTEFQRRVYPRLVAAILLEIKQDARWRARHLDGAVPKGRKVDAQNLEGNFYQGKSFNQWVDFFLANPAYININYQGETDMQLTDPIESRIVVDIDPKTGIGKTVSFKDIIQNIQWNADEAKRAAQQAAAQVGALTALVTQMAASGGGITGPELEAAANAGAKAALAALGRELTD